jgi:hypothetical protein
MELWKPVIDVDPEGSPLFPAAAWDQMDFIRLRPVLARINEYYEGLSKSRANDALTASDRRLLLFAVRLTDILSLRFPDLFPTRSVKRSYLSMLALTRTANEGHALLTQVLLRFLKRGWLSDAAPLANDATAAYLRGTPPDRVSGNPEHAETGCHIESINVLALYHYLTGRVEIAESMIVSGLDCVCDTAAPDLSDEGTGLTF